MYAAWQLNTNQLHTPMREPLYGSLRSVITMQWLLFTPTNVTESRRETQKTIRRNCYANPDESQPKSRGQASEEILFYIKCCKQTGKQKYTTEITKNNASAGSFVKIHINSIYAFTRLFCFVRNMITFRNAAC